MSNNNVSVRTEMNTVKTALEAMKDQFANALPAHITPERMIRVALTAVQNTPKLLECDRSSFYLQVLRAAQLGLEPDGILGQAYLLPYGGKVQLIVGYKGLIDLARRSGEVSNIIAKEVCVNDDFAIEWHNEVPFRHVQSTSTDRGAVIGFWAMARFKDGGFHFDYMTLAEVEAIRDQSQGWQTAKRFNKTAESPWGKHFIEMGKKTAIRRIAKFLPMSVQRAAVVDQLSEAGKKFEVSEFGEIVIDNESQPEAEAPTVETAKPLPAQASKLDEFSSAAEPAEAVTAKPEPEAFDINAHNLKTQAGIKTAMNALVWVLKQYPESERAGIYVMSSGDMVVSAAGRAGLGALKTQITDLGIKLQEEAA